VLDLFRIFADVLFPVFGIAAIGFVAARRWRIPYEALSTIAYRILTPAFIFRILSDPAGFDGPIAKMMATSLGTVVVVWALMTLRLRRQSGERRTLDAMASTFGNVGNLGFPIVLFGLGERSLAPASIHFLSVTIGAFVIGVSMAARLRSGTVGDAIKRVALTPAIAVTPFALVASRAEWAPPEALARLIGLLADAMIPVMLLTLGMQLASAHFTRDIGRLGTIAVAKLVIAPFVFLALAAAVGLEGIARDSGLLLAAMPTAVLVGLISLEFDLESEVASAAILATSLAAIPTLALVLRVL